MQAQYVAIQRSPFGQNDARTPQTARFKGGRYQMNTFSRMFRTRNTQVSLTSEPGFARHEAVPGPFETNRRHRCQRASNSWQQSVSSPLLALVQAGRPTRNTWWLSQSPSQSSQHTQASTSKLAPEQARATAPVSTRTVLRNRGDI